MHNERLRVTRVYRKILKLNSLYNRLFLLPKNSIDRDQERSKDRKTASSTNVEILVSVLTWRRNDRKNIYSAYFSSFFSLSQTCVFPEKINEPRICSSRGYVVQRWNLIKRPYFEAFIWTTAMFSLVARCTGAITLPAPKYAYIHHRRDIWKSRNAKFLLPLPHPRCFSKRDCFTRAGETRPGRFWKFQRARSSRE